MPLYAIQDETTGEQREIILPVSQRDSGVPPGFKRVPAAPGVVVKHRGQPSLAENVRRGYYDAEQKQGSRFQSGFTKKEIAAALDEK